MWWFGQCGLRKLAAFERIFQVAQAQQTFAAAAGKPVLERPDWMPCVPKKPSLNLAQAVPFRPTVLYQLVQGSGGDFWAHKASHLVAPKLVCPRLHESLLRLGNLENEFKSSQLAQTTTLGV